MLELVWVNYKRSEFKLKYRPLEKLKKKTFIVFGQEPTSKPLCFEICKNPLNRLEV